MKVFHRFLLVTGLALVLILGTVFYQTGAASVHAQDEGSYSYVPLPDGIIINDPTVIEGWIGADDIASIRAHAWDLWGGMTTSSGQSYNGVDLPIWDTWYSGHDVYDIGPASAADAALRGSPHDLEMPRQLSGDVSGMSADDAEAVLSFNKFDWDAANHIWSNGYWLVPTLNDLVSQCDPSKPPSSCAIQPFPTAAIATKPVFSLVAQDGITVLPVWEGVVPGETTTWQIGDTSGSPTESTWMQCVAIDTTGANPPGAVIDVTCNNMAMKATVVSLDDFFNFAVTQADVDQLNSSQQAPNVQTAQLADGTTHNIAVGDSLVFVAMHVTTRELDQWAWQTFWWSPEPDDPTPVTFPPTTYNTEEVYNEGKMYVNYPGSGADRPASIEAPWNHYVMCTNYQFVVPNQPLTGGTNVGTAPDLCFNPYLETAFSASAVGPGYFPPGGGINTNCTTCHGQATWGGFNYVPNQNNSGPITLSYTAANYVSRDDARFTGYLQLDFSWNITRAHLSGTPIN